MEQAHFIEVIAGLRLFLDSPHGESWSPIIELATGRVLDWPEGRQAHVHRKVCDEGEYWLLDKNMQRVAKWKDDYPPEEILCIGSAGFGDYINLRVGVDGAVAGWTAPTLLPEQWAPA